MFAITFTAFVLFFHLYAGRWLYGQKTNFQLRGSCGGVAKSNG
jgi:hypothetical protein